MKKCIWGVILLVLLTAGSAMASGIPSFPFIFVSGQAERDVAPDTAKISFSVLVFHEDPGQGLALIEERSVQLMDLFRKFGIEKKNIIAYEITKEVVRERKDYVALKILGYDLTRRMTVTLNQLDRFDELMTQLINLKNVSGIRTVFDTTKRKSIETDLFREAARKAREEADLLARGFGAEIASVHAISVSPGGFGGLEGEFGMGGAVFHGFADAAPTAAREKGMNVLVPSTIKLRKAVSAIYKIK